MSVPSVSAPPPSNERISPEAVKAKLAILADAAKYDASCASSGAQRKRDPNGMGNSEGMGICHSYTPDGRCVSLLKILLTNSCIYDCKFCVNRVSSDVRRARFTPAEVVWLTLEFYRRNYIEGLFLSSGIVGTPDGTMEQLIEVAKRLRRDHKFNGYIHLKIVAGSSQELIHEAGLWADRISANIELPTQADLNLLAPAKTITAVEQTMTSVTNRIEETTRDRKTMVSTPKFAPAGQTTQMVVGATDSPDQSILKTSTDLYQKFGLRRVYYSGYSPIPHADSILPSIKPSLVRENRLYQADWLLRFYGFSVSELFTPEDSNLSLDLDPKTMWALRHRGFFPVHLNTASREDLLRVPGLGVQTVEKILRARRFQKLRLHDLSKLHVPMKRVKYFVQGSDHNPFLSQIDQLTLESHLKPAATQMSFFDLPKAADAS